eukprot:3295132-Rhodomonas_salina.2
MPLSAYARAVAMAGTTGAYAATHVLCDVRYAPVSAYARAMRRPVLAQRISLRACYATFGTCLAYAAFRLRDCYATSGADLAYAATSRTLLYYRVALPPTNPLYGPTNFLPDVRHFDYDPRAQWV